MSDTDKLSWLMLGRGPTAWAATTPRCCSAPRSALLAGEGSRRPTTLMSALGLDELSVRQTDGGTTRDTVVTLGKQLSQRWYVGYERGVNATTGTWQLIYRIAQRFTLRAQSGDETPRST